MTRVYVEADLAYIADEVTRHGFARHRWATGGADGKPQQTDIGNSKRREANESRYRAVRALVNRGDMVPDRGDPQLGPAENSYFPLRDPRAQMSTHDVLCYTGLALTALGVARVSFWWFGA